MDSNHLFDKLPSEIREAIDIMTENVALDVNYAIRQGDIKKASEYYATFIVETNNYYVVFTPHFEDGVIKLPPRVFSKSDVRTQPVPSRYAKSLRFKKEYSLANELMEHDKLWLLKEIKRVKHFGVATLYYDDTSDAVAMSFIHRNDEGINKHMLAITGTAYQMDLTDDMDDFDDFDFFKNLFGH